MEHLLLPAGATIAANERAPYVAEQYNGPFMEFPKKSRFNELYQLILPPDNYRSSELDIWGDRLIDLEIFIQT